MGLNKNVVITCAGFLLCLPKVYAAGFQLLEQSASAMGTAYAGTAVNTENASALFYNPAGMTELSGTNNVSAGIAIVRPSFRFSDRGGSRNPALPGIPGSALNGSVPQGSDGGDAGKLAAVPNIYYARKVNERVSVGAGVSVPFGLVSNYHQNWKGQYHSKKFDVRSVNFNASIAAKINERVSIGVGVNAQRVEAEYARKVAVPLTASPAGPYTTGDARALMKDTAFYLNAGVLVKLSDNTRVGLAWRGSPHHKAKGTTQITNIVTPKGVLMKSYDAVAKVALPDSLTLSAAHQISPQFTLLADLAHYRWSRMKEFRIHNAGLGSEALPLHFRDTWRASLGAIWHVRPNIALKTGIGYDQTPVSSVANRPAAMPDNDRFWLAMGMQYQISPTSTFDVSYAHLFIDDSEIDSSFGSDVSKGRLHGVYKDSADMLGAQFSSKF